MIADPPASQASVYAVFGRCLLRLQQYELLLKKMLSTRSMTTSSSGSVPTDSKLAREIPTSTLGLLAREFFQSFVVIAGVAEHADSTAHVAKAAPAEVTLRTTVCIEMSPQEHEVNKQRVADLVELRNTLAHHFIERFDLWSEQGCGQALQYLNASCERIGRDLEQLQGWARSMDESLRGAAAFLLSDASDKLLAHGMASDGAETRKRKLRGVRMP